MTAKILYLVQRYKPHIEATSKEVKVLLEHQPKSFLHDLHLDSPRQMRFDLSGQPQQCSYHFAFYPLLLPFLYLYSWTKIKHVYTNLTDFPYLRFLSKRQMVLTSTNYFGRGQLQKRLPQLRKVAKIVVEAEVQKGELLAAGLPEQQMEVIYPPVDLHAFRYHPVPLSPTTPLKILNASCPAKTVDLEKRGIVLLQKALPSLPDVQLTLLWREPEGEMPQFIQSLTGQSSSSQNQSSSLLVRTEVIVDMNTEYAQHHALIIPYTTLHSRLKLMPNSAIESLAAGKPLAVSSQTGIAPLVYRERCGVVFEPTPESLRAALGSLRKNYARYQQNCRKTAEKYFAREEFIARYAHIYQELENDIEVSRTRPSLS